MRSVRRYLLVACCGWFFAGGTGDPLNAAETTAAAAAPVSSASRPLSPAESLKHFELHPDCRIELVAAEPDVIDPVHIAFDDRARLWVVEYSDYPNGPADGQPGLSRIRVLTDADADGRYEAPVTFADKLLFATGLLPWRDGVIVTTGGSVLFLRDTDGDGRADDTQEWFVGFKEENPQLRANHPTLAIDNHIYIASGIRGGDVRPGKDWAKAFGRDPADTPAPASLSGRDFRFDPLTGDFEAVSGPGQFGLTFDDWGRRFVCDNRHPCKHLVFEETDLKLNPHVTVSQIFADALPAGEESRLYPISRTWTTSNLHANQFTAACGLHLYRGQALPAAMHGQPFVCDPTGNLVHHERLLPAGATFRSEPDRPGVEFLATKDEWFRAVNLTTGPDGALYVVDMYRAVIEHPQFMPEELKNRPDLLLGTDRGRIYRIVARDAQTPPPVKCIDPATTTTVDGWLALLRHPCGWQRDLGQRRLLENSKGEQAAAGEQLAALCQDASPAARAIGLWQLAKHDGANAEMVRKALNDADPRVQEQAIRILSTTRIEDADLGRQILELANSTSDARLRFVAVLGLGAVTATLDASPQLARLALANLDDPWLQSAIRLVARDPRQLAERIATEARAARRSAAAAPGALLALVESFAVLAGRQLSNEDVAALLKAWRQEAEQVDEVDQSAVLGLCRGLKLRRVNFRQVAPEAANPEAARYLHDVFARSGAAVAAGGTGGLSTSIALLEFADWKDAAVLLEVAKNHRDAATRRAAVDVLSRRSETEIGPALVENLAGETPDLRNARLAAIFASTPRIALLLDAVSEGSIPARLIDAARVKQLTSHRDAAIRKRSEEIFAALTPAERKQVLADYQKCLDLTADPARGRAVFQSQCSTCHRIGEIGVLVAPDISDSRTKTREYLLTAILDPNQAIDNNYFSYTVVDRDGIVYTGIVATETATSVTLKQPEGKTVTLLRENIEEMRSNGISLMPEGLERTINPQQMADLISFIKNWRYLDGSVPPEVIR